MPEFGTLGGYVSRNIGGDTSDSGGAAVTPGAGSKGSWVEIIGSTEFDAHWIEVYCGVGGGYFRVDIGIGAATEQVIIPDLYFVQRTTGSDHPPYMFPLFIPKGSRISARAARHVGTTATDITVNLFSGSVAGPPPVASRVSCYGSVAVANGTNIDPGGTAHTKSAWVQITSATERDHHWLVLSTRNGNGGSPTSQWLLDVGIGSATEQVLVENILMTLDSGTSFSMGSRRHLPLFVPAGSRLAIRAQCSNTTDSERDVYANIYGC